MNTRICPDIVVLVFWIKQKWKHLAVVDIGKGNRISMDEAMDNIDANTVLLTVVTEAILLFQRASKSFCCKRYRFSSQPSGSLPALISMFSLRVLSC